VAQQPARGRQALRHPRRRRHHDRPPGALAPRQRLLRPRPGRHRRLQGTLHRQAQQQPAPRPPAARPRRAPHAPGAQARQQQPTGPRPGAQARQQQSAGRLRWRHAGHSRDRHLLLSFHIHGQLLLGDSHLREVVLDSGRLHDTGVRRAVLRSHAYRRKIR
jgi:hypothetical protein